MTITPEMEAEILRLYQVEGWLRTTIARQFGIHHGVVHRVLCRAGVAIKVKQNRKSKADIYLPFIKESLEKYPKLSATRLHHMVKERGFTGGIDHFRDIVRELRPKPTSEAFLRLSTLPGEEAQVDWGAFGKLRIGEAEHRLLAFVMVLSYSRRIFLRFYLGDDTANFLRGHVGAFEHFESVPRTLLYDNLKTAVLERVENAIRFNTELIKLAAHYRFAPKPVPVARPTSKGKVERAIQYVRSSFFMAREFEDLEDLNVQAIKWCQKEAERRQCRSDTSLTVAEAFQKERQHMIALPGESYPIFERKPVQVGKTPYVRFQGNDYSVPHKFVRRSLLVQASSELVQIVNGLEVVAEHSRSYNKGELIENPKHINDLIEQKKNPNPHRGMNRLFNVIPSSQEFFKRAAERGHNMGRLTQLLIQLLELYGSSELEAAIHEALVRGSLHSESVRKTLEKNRTEKGLALPKPLAMMKDQRIDELAVVPKDLELYDRLFRMEEQD
jgi:transposase